MMVANFEPTFDEQKLATFAICQMMARSVVPCALELAAEATVKFGLLRRFDEDVPTLSHLRGYAVKQLDKVWEEERGAAYWDSVRKLNRVAKRVHDLITRFDVFHPISVYHTEYLGGTVEGYFGVIGVRDPAGRWLKRRLLQTHLTTARAYRRYPAVVEMARAGNAWRTCTAVDVGPLGIVETYHLPLIYGEPWVTRTRGVIANAAIGAVVNALRHQNAWPNPGSHCQLCVRKDCLDVYVRPNEDRGERR